VKQAQEDAVIKENLKHMVATDMDERNLLMLRAQKEHVVPLSNLALGLGQEFRTDRASCSGMVYILKILPLGLQFNGNSIPIESEVFLCCWHATKGLTAQYDK